MPINEQEWVSIHEMVEREVGRIIGKRMDYFIMTKVNKTDQTKKLIWVDEFGQTPVPMYSYDYEIAYYDTQPSGNAVRKLAKVTPIMPIENEIVLICREMGADRLPRCLGALRSVDFLIDEDEGLD